MTTAENGYERPAIAGSGTIACGLAACASVLGEVRLLARSDASAARAEEQARTAAEKLEGGNPDAIRITMYASELANCDLIVEAITEDIEAKAEVLSELGAASTEADLASTTSSLSIAQLAARSGHAERLFGLHVFNPVPRMELVELCVPDGVRAGVGDRARAWCQALGKTAVDVPDTAGFVVNRLLFPFLFDAVRLLESGGLSAAAVDDCMQLGAGHPMGPLKLLDFVGLDVAVAIGESLYAESGDDAHKAPARLLALVAEGNLGKKTGKGFFSY
jgi:3-hydroxybutyryl-CoA dehydrogenase